VGYTFSVLFATFGLFHRESTRWRLGGELQAVLEQLKAYPPVKVAPHFDGPGTVRRAEDALRAVRRIR